MRLAALITPLALAACDDPAPTAERLIPDYRGIETRALAGDLVQIRVEMTNALSAEDVSDYADCAAAGYTLGLGGAFARHLRTTVEESNAVWRGDAIYTISAGLPEGIAKLDAEVVAEGCREKGIPVG